MSIWTSLYTGRSGLTAHGNAINVVGDNIANVSTVGFKSGSAQFNDVLGRRTLGGQNLGAGVAMGNVSQGFGQGSVIQSGGSLDYMIQGEGFFSVMGTVDGIEGQYYSRDGRFQLNSDGLLVNSDGLRVQGYPLDADGEINGPVGDISLDSTVPPVATTSANLEFNLDPSAPLPATAPFDPADPDTYAHQTSMTVYDSLGTAREVNLHFVPNGAGAWDWHATVDGAELTGGTAGVQTEVASGSLTFNANGQLDTETVNASSADFLNAVPGQAIAFDFGDAITTDGGTGASSTTQVAGEFTTVSQRQDGRAAGDLVDVVTSDDGTITGQYSNGQEQQLGQLALAQFQSPESLRRQGDKLWSATTDSGQAVLGEAGTGGRGAIGAGALEGSNVDLGQELVTLIAYQRAFQANARTITTADEMLAEVSNLKR